MRQRPRLVAGAAERQGELIVEALHLVGVERTRRTRSSARSIALSSAVAAFRRPVESEQGPAQMMQARWGRVAVDSTAISSEDSASSKRRASTSTIPR